MTVLFLRLLVVAFAAHRLARALAVDSISDPFRDWLYAGAYAVDRETGDVTIVGGKFWQWAYALCSCIFCCGFWLGLGLYVLWLNAGWTRPFIGALAVTGIVALLAAADRAMARD